MGRAQEAWGPGARRGDNERVVPFLGAATTQMAPNPLRPKGCRGTAPPAVLSLLDDVLGHRRRRDALHPGPWRRQRDLRGFPAPCPSCEPGATRAAPPYLEMGLCT